MFAWLTDIGMWWGVFKVTSANLLLSFDNAIIIALVASCLPVRQRKTAIVLGVALATAILLVLAPVGIYVLAYPYLRFAGGLLLMWIAVKLLIPDDEGESELTGTSTLLGALKAIAIANVIRSIDNVLGVAAAADGNIWLLIVGLVISMPVLIYGSFATMALVERYPAFSILGAAFIGFLAGEMIASDAVVDLWVQRHVHVPGWHNVLAVMSAGLVVLLGKVLTYRMRPATVPVAEDQRHSGPT
jgi:YjbE family integral membrane protein